MAKSMNQKGKLLSLARMLWEQTDENHTLSMQEILEQLNRQGIKAERKSIYHDMETLKAYGYAIVNRKEHPAGYFLDSRPFSLKELKLLTDAVQAYHLVTQKGAEELSKKLESQTSVHQAKQLRRPVIAASRVVNRDEAVSQSMDRIYAAISGNLKLSFQYGAWMVSRDGKPVRRRQKYRVSPWSVSWAEDTYYLAGWDEASGGIKSFKVDRMYQLCLLGEFRSETECLNPKSGGEYHVEEMDGKTCLTLLVENRLANVILDRYGRDSVVGRADEGHFLANMKSHVSLPFFAWLVSMGNGVKLLAPAEAVAAYRDYIKNILIQYL